MARTTTKELTEQNKRLEQKLANANSRADNILSKVGGLRAHCLQNSVSNEDIIRILEDIIQNS
tara:strand:- start:2282 stop:2470 length:189 start_codon:yes stop_codon:yes gene_type:complete